MDILEALNELNKAEQETPLYTKKLNKSVDSISAAYALINDEIEGLNISESIKREIAKIINKVETLTNSINVNEINLDDLSKFMQETNLNSVVSMVQFIGLFSSIREVCKLVSENKRVEFKPDASIRNDASKFLSDDTIDNLAKFRPVKRGCATGIGEILIAVIYRGGALSSGRGDISIGGINYEIKTDEGAIHPLSDNPYLYKSISEILALTGAVGSKGNIGSGVRSNFKNIALTQEQLDQINEKGKEIGIQFERNTTQQNVFDELFKLALNTYLRDDEKILLTNASSKSLKLNKSIIISKKDTAAELADKGVNIIFSDNRNSGQVFKITLR